MDTVQMTKIALSLAAGDKPTWKDTAANIGVTGAGVVGGGAAGGLLGGLAGGHLGDYAANALYKGKDESVGRAIVQMLLRLKGIQRYGTAGLLGGGLLGGIGANRAYSSFKSSK